MRDIMRNLPGSLGHGEFIIVILCIPGRTYIILSSRVGSEPIDKKVMIIQEVGNFR